MQWDSVIHRQCVNFNVIKSNLLYLLFYYFYIYIYFEVLIFFRSFHHLLFAICNVASCMLFVAGLKNFAGG